mmetsp:Transcript_21067/g.43764  ORF Transcript_21067/g.43764 Transcript_21067/m.43764 type:complete len:366 (-) Transcript_21067:98-1195(-)
MQYHTFHSVKLFFSQILPPSTPPCTKPPHQIRTASSMNHVNHPAGNNPVMSLSQRHNHRGGNHGDQGRLSHDRFGIYFGRASRGSISLLLDDNPLQLRHLPLRTLLQHRHPRPHQLQPRDPDHDPQNAHRQGIQQGQGAPAQKHRQRHLHRPQRHDAGPVPGPEAMLTRQSSGSVAIGHGTQRTEEEVHESDRYGHVSSGDDGVGPSSGFQAGLALFGVEVVSKAAYGYDGVETGEGELREGSLEEALAPVEGCDVGEGVDDDGGSEEMEGEVVLGGGGGGCGEGDGGEEGADEEEVYAHGVGGGWVWMEAVEAGGEGAKGVERFLENVGLLVLWMLWVGCRCGRDIVSVIGLLHVGIVVSRWVG